jgi:hypothetical protein
MKALNIEIDDSLYDSLLEILKKLPENKIKIQELNNKNCLNFTQATNHALNKNKSLYKRLS